MLSRVSTTWTKIFVGYVYILNINASLKRSGTSVLTKSFPKQKFYPKLNLRTEDLSIESGFALNKDDMAKFHVWPSGIIPYYIDDFSFDKVLRDRLRIFLDNVNRLTGLQFVEIPKPPKDDNSRWVIFLNRKGLLNCADHAFKNFTTEGVQRVVLGYHCLYSDEGLADIVLSIVGVPPQHTSPDRDKYITVKKENIIPDKLYLFDKLKDNEWLFHNLNYDYLSAGHYGNYKYTLNGSATYEIVISEMPKIIDKEKGFTNTDVLKIQMLYNYISRNRETPHNIPECSKLFKPSSKLSGNIQLESKDEIKPRPKPNQYLGETEKIQEYDMENKDKNDKETSDDDEIKNEENDSSNKNDNEDNDNDYNENGQKMNYKQENETENTITLNNKKGINSDSYEHVEVVDKVTKPDSKINENDKKQSTNITNLKKRLSLTYKVEAKKQKLLGQSDYETGDEGDKKYIHEKNA